MTIELHPAVKNRIENEERASNPNHPHNKALARADKENTAAYERTVKGKKS